MEPIVKILMKVAQILINVIKQPSVQTIQDLISAVVKMAMEGSASTVKILTNALKRHTTVEIGGLLNV
jgi:hypothetical protein